MVQLPLYAADIQETLTPLPLLLVAVPIAGSLLICLGGRAGEHLRSCLAIGISACSFILAVILFAMTRQGDAVWQIASFLDTGLKFRVDMLGGIFLLLTTFIWLPATIFSRIYMEHGHGHARYYCFLTLTLGGCLGVYLMEDFPGLLLFFELMSLASYVLIVHTETKEAISAGRNYLYLCIISGLLILTGIFLLYDMTGTMTITPPPGGLPLPASSRCLLAALFLAGFGIKAGMVPLHIWLPQAHPVAPSPVSALLSGLMIKTGAYGIMRTIGVLFPPVGRPIPPLEQAVSLGLIIIWLGLATMFIAAFIALFQSNAKRILAYSSISQMGYILLGLGCAACLGCEGSPGLAGSNYHIINHAFFKAGMFMMIGAVYLRTHEVQLPRLGGLYRHLPVTSLAFLICALSLAGVPGFGGYASKTLLHHALDEAYRYHRFVSLLWVEKVFTLTGALTVCYITRLYTAVFLGREKTGWKFRKETPVEKAIFAAIALGVLLMGLFPAGMLKSVLIPLVQRLGSDPRGMVRLAESGILTGHDLGGAAIALGLGLVIFFILSRRGAFAYRLPGWLSVEGAIYLPLIQAAGFIFTSLGRAIDAGADAFLVKNVDPLKRFSLWAAGLESRLYPRILLPALKILSFCFMGAGSMLEHGVESLLSLRTPLFRFSGGMDDFDNVFLRRLAKGVSQIALLGREFLCGFLRQIFMRFACRGKVVAGGIAKFLTKVDDDPQGDETFIFFNILNFNIGVVLPFLAFVIIALLGLIWCK